MNIYIYSRIGLRYYNICFMMLWFLISRNGTEPLLNCVAKGRQVLIS